MKDKREELVSLVISPILATANRIFEVSKHKLEFHDGEIGYWREHRFVAHDVFSGTEQLLAYTGFALGLSAKADLRLCIMDEFGRLSRETKDLVLAALEKALDDKAVDQCIVVDTDADYYASVGPTPEYARRFARWTQVVTK